MTQFIFSPLCHYCKHYDYEANRHDWRVNRCKAFEDGIPSPILRLEYDHRAPHEGDDGITFEKYDDIKKLPRHLQSEMTDPFLALTFRLLEHERLAGRALPPITPEELEGVPTYDEAWQEYLRIGNQIREQEQQAAKAMENPDRPSE